MKLQVVALVIVLMTDTSLSVPAPDPQYSLPSINNNSTEGLKTVAIKGIAKYKPGGTAMIVSLLIQGIQGLIPGETGSHTTSSPGSASPALTTPSSGSASPASTTPSSGSASPGSVSPTSTTQIPTGGPGSSTPSSGNEGGYQGNDDEKIGLDEHNKFRKIHGSQPMKLNKKMCEQAKAYAETIAQTGAFKHSSREERNGQGENLSMGCSSKQGGQTVQEAVASWYNEVCSPGYPFGSVNSPKGAGHFTQVVWNDSIELGIGKAEATERGMKCSYIVGRYKPLGNFGTGNDDYNKNVKKGNFDRQSYCSSIKKLKTSFKKSSVDLSKIL